ncbi:hypothetical protein ADK54_41665 [Streptomyces sp. WM6378]|nr:hypothetical protein ADK54_41665 [Streptomyces sp. WM6378]
MTSEVRGGAEPTTLEAGPARASGPGRRGPEQDGVLGQAGGEGDVRWQADSIRIIEAASSTFVFPPGRHRRAMTGMQTERERKGRRTIRPSTMKQVPYPTGRGPFAAPSCCQNAPNTFFPDRLNRVSSTAATSGAPSAAAPAR